MTHFTAVIDGVKIARMCDILNEEAECEPIGTKSNKHHTEEAVCGTTEVVTAGSIFSFFLRLSLLREGDTFTFRCLTIITDTRKPRRAHVI